MPACIVIDEQRHPGRAGRRRRASSGCRSKVGLDCHVRAAVDADLGASLAALPTIGKLLPRREPCLMVPPTQAIFAKPATSSCSQAGWLPHQPRYRVSPNSFPTRELPFPHGEVRAAHDAVREFSTGEAASLEPRTGRDANSTCYSRQESSPPTLLRVRGPAVRGSRLAADRRRRVGGDDSWSRVTCGVCVTAGAWFEARRLALSRNSRTASCAARTSP